jgi:hypothetical protein
MYFPGLRARVCVCLSVCVFACACTYPSYIFTYYLTLNATNASTLIFICMHVHTRTHIRALLFLQPKAQQQCVAHKHTLPPHLFWTHTHTRTHEHTDTYTIQTHTLNKHFLLFFRSYSWRHGSRVSAGVRQSARCLWTCFYSTLRSSAPFPPPCLEIVVRGIASPSFTSIKSWTSGQTCGASSS